jgi:hypothetical protein
MGEKWESYQEIPLKLDNPIFLPPRPNPGIQNGAVETIKKVPRALPTPLTGEEKNTRREEYQRNIVSPATQTWRSFPTGDITEVLNGKAWVVPNLLSEVECEELIKAGEDFGLERAVIKNSYRTSKRTNAWSNRDLSIKLKGRLPEELLMKLEGTFPYTSVRGVHPNWRLACYEEGGTFPAHIDQADSLIVQHPEKVSFPIHLIKMSIVMRFYVSD